MGELKMSAANIVRGQKIDPVKAMRARELRRRMTSEESVIWQALRRSAVGYHFRRQQVIAGFIVDFYCHAAALAVEIDGAAHDLRCDYDAARDQVLAGQGIRVLRIKNEAVKRDIGAVIEQIVSAVKI